MEKWIPYGTMGQTIWARCQGIDGQKQANESNMKQACNSPVLYHRVWLFRQGNDDNNTAKKLDEAMQVLTRNQTTECATFVLTTAISNLMQRLAYRCNATEHTFATSDTNSRKHKAENEERQHRYNMRKTVSDTHIETTKDFKHATTQKPDS